MDLNVLTPKLREAYIKISECLKKNPGMTVADAAVKSGAVRSYYFTARKKLLEEAGEIERVKRKNDPKSGEQKRKYNKTRLHSKKRITMHTIPVDEAPINLNQVIAFVGTTKSVVDSIRELLK